MPKKDAPSLIDTLYRSSFNKERVNGWASNADMRAALIGARRFMLDERMSSFLADLSTTAFRRGSFQGGPRAAKLIDQMRTSARLPHASTWIEFDLQAFTRRRLDLTGEPFAGPESGPGSFYDQIPHIEGWLLRQHPKIDTAVQAYVFLDNRGHPDFKGYETWTFPLTYMWTTNDDPLPWVALLPERIKIQKRAHVVGEEVTPLFRAREDVASSELISALTGYVSNHVSATVGNLIAPAKTLEPSDYMLLLTEWAGIIRRMWALLATINDIPISITDVRQSRGFVARGRYRHFLDHTTITLRVPDTRDVRRVARQVIAISRRRAHQVRGHFRVDWRNRPRAGCLHEWDNDNRCRRCNGHRLWIAEHQRGDASLGFVTHDYEVVHD